MLCQIDDAPRTTRDALPLRVNPCLSRATERAVKTVFQMIDLFGDVQITIDDLHAWVSAIAPAWASTERSLSYYIRHWDVAGKVRHAKLAGTFDATIENARSRRAFLIRRFGLTSGA
jgi:hypothetical protein